MEQKPRYYVPSSSVSVDYPTTINLKRKINQSVNNGDQYTFSGPSEVSISFDFYFLTDMPIAQADVAEYAYIFMVDSAISASGEIGNATGSNYFPIQVGNNLYKKCLLESFDITLRPFEPVKGRASFKCYQPPTNETISGDYNLLSAYSHTGGSGISEPDLVIDSNKVVYGHTCSVSGAGQAVSADVISSINYKKQYKHTPVYSIGSTYPSRYLVDEVVAEIQIESTGLNSLIGISGGQLTSDLVITLANSSGSKIAPAGVDFDLSIPSGSRIYSENYSMAEGDYVVSSASIQQIIV